MLATLVQAAGGLALLTLGAEALVRGAATLASRLGVSPLAIGLTVVAFGTSTPELVVSVDAAFSGANDISVGNVVGSNIANVALILGLSALLRPTAVEAKLVRIDAPVLVAVSFALVAVLADGRASRIEGAALVVALLLYLAFTFRTAQREPPTVQGEFAAAAPERPLSTWAGALGAALGLGLLVGGGHLFVEAAVGLATLWGVSQAAIGLTVVAIGTSLPELATSVVASLRGQGDIAVGNVVGSNIFNVLGILGVTASLEPLTPGGITGVDLGVMVVLSCALSALLFFRPRLGRREGGVLLVAFTLYMGWIFAT